MKKDKEYILCAAIWYDDGLSYDDEEKEAKKGEKRAFPAHFRGATYQNTNISTGYVICGWRHGNIIAVKPCNPAWCPEIKDTVQGFLTNKGRFVDRWQAAYIASEAKQPLMNGYNESYFKDSVEHLHGPNDEVLMVKFKDGTVWYGDEWEKFTKELMESKPSDNRFGDKMPFKMLFSEDFY